MTNDGGPAFPNQKAAKCENWAEGMSLRDWFAGKALEGMLSDSRVVDTADAHALVAYRLADAMLKARKP